MYCCLKSVLVIGLLWSALFQSVSTQATGSLSDQCSDYKENESEKVSVCDYGKLKKEVTKLVELYFSQQIQISSLQEEVKGLVSREKVNTICKYILQIICWIVKRLLLMNSWIRESCQGYM